MKRKSKRKIENNKRPRHKRNDDDEEIDSDEIGGDDFLISAEEKEDDELMIQGNVALEEEEDADERRIRLANEYLRKIEARSKESGIGTDDLLEEDYYQESKHFRYNIARLVAETTGKIHAAYCRGHQASVTCLAGIYGSKFLFSGGKDGCIIKWDSETMKKVFVINSFHSKKGKRNNNQSNQKNHGHSGRILTLAISSDGKLLASGGDDKMIRLWNSENGEFKHMFSGHRDIVTGLRFRYGTYGLFSTSNDRTLKVWNCDEMMFVETLHGHQSGVEALDTLPFESGEEKCISCGFDTTVRLWKIVEESQMVFRGNNASVDTVCFIDDRYFATGSQDGLLCLWTLRRKKPILKRNVIQDIEEFRDGVKPNMSFVDSNKELISIDPWILKVVYLPRSNLLVCCIYGHVLLYQLFPPHLLQESDSKPLECVGVLEINGFPNDIIFSNSGKEMCIALGREVKSGRWWVSKKSRNGLLFLKVNIPSEEELKKRYISS